MLDRLTTLQDGDVTPLRDIWDWSTSMSEPSPYDCLSMEETSSPPLKTALESIQMNRETAGSRAKENVLARQVIRWTWETQQVQRLQSISCQTWPTHPMRTAWLWIEEYGAELWPAEIEKRGHLHPRFRNPTEGFVYLRDRGKRDKIPFEGFDDIVGHMPDFCFEDGRLSPFNSMFWNILYYFADVYLGVYSCDITSWEGQTAAQLMAEFLGQKPWVPGKEFLPLYYQSSGAGCDDSLNSSSCSGSTCSCSVDGTECTGGAGRSSSRRSSKYVSALEQQFEQLTRQAASDDQGDTSEQKRLIKRQKRS